MKLGSKKILNLFVLDNIEIIKNVDIIGSQSVVVSVDIIKRNNNYFIFDYRPIP